MEELICEIPVMNVEICRIKWIMVIYSYLLAALEINFK